MKISKMKVKNPNEGYFLLWQELLDSDDFLSELQGATGHLSFAEANELVHYLGILNYVKHMEDLSDKNKGESDLKILLEDFEKNSTFTNPFFRADVVTRLSADEYKKLGIYLKNKDLKHEKAHSAAKEIVRLNWHYPCWTVDPYRCPASVRSIRDMQVVAYDSLVKSALLLEDKKKIEDIPFFVIDFMHRFYPGTDFNKGDFKALEKDQISTNNYLPALAVYAGTGYYEKDKEISKRFFTVATKVSCLYNGKGPSFEECTQAQDSAKLALLLFPKEEKKE
jgi:hypothetical protein